jgi:hypothetical protein
MGSGHLFITQFGYFALGAQKFRAGDMVYVLLGEGGSAGA